MVTKEAELGAYYLLNIDKLEPGDIMLSRIPMNLHDTSTWDSHLIQTLTRSRFSLAALHLADGLCIEAVGSGVAKLPLVKAGIRDVRNVCVLRARKGSEWAGKKAAVCGAGYMKQGFYRAGSPQTKCSAFHDVRQAAVSGSGLTAQAYADAGFSLLEGKPPTAIFPGDFLQSTLVEDITGTVLQRLITPKPVAFHLDDSTLFDRVHHWEAATQLKVICNYEVRRILDASPNRPTSMRELELLIAEKCWSALDEAVIRSLRWYRYADVYNFKQQRLLGDSNMQSSIIRRLPATLDSDRLVDAEQSVNDDLRLFDGERAHWILQRDYYSDLQRRYAGKTFAYMIALYEKQLAASEQLLQLKTQLKNSLNNEMQRRSLRLKTA